MVIGGVRLSQRATGDLHGEIFEVGTALAMHDATCSRFRLAKLHLLAWHVSLASFCEGHVGEDVVTGRRPP